VPLYAHQDIPEVWVVDVGREQIHCHRSPQNGRYTVSTVAPLSDRLTIASLATEIDLSSAAARRTD
jgi:Uma2 family endonuclease